MSKDCIILTPEKQIALLKYLIINQELCIGKVKTNDNFYMDAKINRGNGISKSDFAECIADVINSLWNDLSAADKDIITQILTHSGPITEENFESALQEIRDLNNQLMEEYPECSEYCDRISKILNPPETQEKGE